jgi:hypothetical protein
MGQRWCEDGKRNRLHCFETKAAEVAAGAVALCGWVFEGVTAAGLTEAAQWRAISGDRSICHDCNVKWERATRAISG